MQDLHKCFGNHAVLKGIDFQVQAGRSSASIGPSGSGKSTLLRCVNRLEEPTSGRIVIEGIDITDPETDIDEVRSRIGMVFQQFNLFPHLSVLRNLTLAQQRVKKRSKDEAVEVARANLDASGWPRRKTPTRRTSPAASSNGSRSPGRCRWIPT